MTDNIRAWCASHIDSKYKPVLINQMLESLAINNINNCEISISFKQTYSVKEKTDMINGINSFIKKLKVRFPKLSVLTYIDMTEELTQFEHLKRLYKVFAGKSTDKIMFIDDDDILLSLPKEYISKDIVQGIQYIPINTCDKDLTYKKNHTDILETAQTYATLWTIDCDFSGYMCRYQDLIEYFTMIRVKRIHDLHTNVVDEEKRKILLTGYGAFEDTEFMDYLDNLGAIHVDKPFMFRRLWQADDRDMQLWKIKLEIAK
jgi:hypothetical protein